MLASLFGKVTSSLGKTYVFSGLLPASIFLLVVGSFYFPISTVARIGEEQLSLTDAWKSVAWIGAVWLALGFAFYSVRAWFFSCFEAIPVSRIGRFFLFRRIAKRERATRTLQEIEWRSTAFRWLTEFNLDRDQIGDIPSWLVRSCPIQEDAIAASQAGRETLMNVDRTVGDALNLKVRHADVIADGIFSLYRFAKNTRSRDAETTISSEIAGWRFAFASQEAEKIVDLVWNDVLRKKDKAVGDKEKFGQGQYVFPTALGDLISALDDYGQDRYGIDTTTMWDRLWWVLPKDVKAEVSDARLALDTLINLVFALALAVLTVLSSQLLACGFHFTLGSCTPVRGATWILLGVIVASMVYGGARFAMEILTSKMVSLLDMYRLAMIAQLGFAPKTVGEELLTLGQLKNFFTQKKKLDPKLGLVPPKSEGKAEKSDAKEERPEKEDTQSKDNDGAESDVVKDSSTLATTNDPAD